MSSTSEFDIDVDEVSLSTRTSWCASQINTCSTLCNSCTESNTCDCNTLEYSCTCQNGSSPGLQYYTQTMPTYICEQAYSDCISEDTAQATCKTNIGDKCGTLDPDSSSSAEEGIQDTTTTTTTTVGSSLTVATTTTSSPSPSDTGNSSSFRTTSSLLTSSTASVNNTRTPLAAEASSSSSSSPSSPLTTTTTGAAINITATTTSNISSSGLTNDMKIGISVGVTFSGLVLLLVLVGSILRRNCRGESLAFTLSVRKRRRSVAAVVGPVGEKYAATEAGPNDRRSWRSRVKSWRPPKSPVELPGTPVPMPELAGDGWPGGKGGSTMYEMYGDVPILPR